MNKLFSYLSKNAALLIGIIEAVLKALAGISSLTPTKADDKAVAFINDLFSNIKSFFYDISDENNIK